MTQERSTRNVYAIGLDHFKAFDPVLQPGCFQLIVYQ